MRRTNQRQSEAMAAALGLVPAGVRLRLDGTHVLMGVDPVFAGLHSYEVTSQEGVAVRSYRSTAHVAYGFHQPLPASRRDTTVVVPVPAGLPALVHELGHVLHEQVGFSWRAPALTAYAAVDRYEAFAEAFTAWVLPRGCSYDAARDGLAGTETEALFTRLDLGD